MAKKKYEDGGEIDDSLLSNKDNAKSIGEDSRAKAMEFLRTGKKDESVEPSTEPRKIDKPSTTSKPVLKAKSIDEAKVEPKPISDSMTQSIDTSIPTVDSEPKIKPASAKFSGRFKGPKRKEVDAPKDINPVPEVKRKLNFTGPQRKFKTGGKVAGKLATRGYGKAR